MGWSTHRLEYSWIGILIDWGIHRKEYSWIGILIDWGTILIGWSTHRLEYSETKMITKYHKTHIGIKKMITYVVLNIT
jgi:hypothetical protein